MREDLLHFVWKHRTLPVTGMQTTAGAPLKIMQPGVHNDHSGPDFFNAKLEIGDQVWAGNVEIHVKASDWYLHGHENDPGYDSVILHVVWLADVQVIRRDQTPLAALELRQFIPEKMLRTYRRLLYAKNLRFINCERQIGGIESLHIEHWLERMYFERLDRKAREVEQMMNISRNDWEQVFFRLLLRNFGLNVNGDSFSAIGEVIPVSAIRKLGPDQQKLECLLFGVAGFLEASEVPDHYYQELRSEFQYLTRRFSLPLKKLPKPEFLRLRPANFPTIRLSQFAGLYAKQLNLFSKAIKAMTIGELYELFSASAGSYWDNHYTFGNPSGSGKKTMSRGFIDLLLINTVIPVKYSFARHQGRHNNSELAELLSSISPERNQIIKRFAGLCLPCSNVMQTQGLLQLYREYCTKNRCLYCAVGSRILSGK